MPKMTGYARTEEEPKLLGDLAAGTSQQVAPVQAPPPTMAPPPAAPAAQPALAPAAPPPPAQPAPMKLPGMPPGVGEADIRGYLDQQRQGFNRFGADERMALQNDLNARRNSLGFRATSGLKGLADAIMMGVAGAGNPGFKQSFLSEEQQFAQDQVGALKDARALNTESVQAGMTMDQMDPSSKLSRAKQASYAPLFEKLGYPKESIRTMSAANIDASLALMAQYGGKEIEALLRGQEMKLAVQQFEESKRHNEQMEELQSIDDRMKAAEETLDRGRFFGIPIPFMAAPLKDRMAAERYISQVTEGAGDAEIDGSPPPNPEITQDVLDAAEKWGITPEQALRIKKQRGG